MDGLPNNLPETVIPLSPLKHQDLGSGLELWLVPISWPKEQTVNARVMSPDAFNQLADNIKRETRLESLPLCALVNNTLEIISGHHRIRAAKKAANIPEIWVLVDITGLARDKIRSKQLSHNSLQGFDDAELVAKIFKEIQDSEAKIEAFINMESLLPKKPLDLTTDALDLEFQPKVAAVAFLPAQFDVFKKSMTLLKNMEVSEAFIATVDEYDTLMAAMDLTSETFKIHSVPTLLAKMAEIVVEHCNKQPKKE